MLCRIKYENNNELIVEIDDITPRFIRNPVRSKIRLQYSYGARRLLVPVVVFLGIQWRQK